MLYIYLPNDVGTNQFDGFQAGLFNSFIIFGSSELDFVTALQSVWALVPYEYDLFAIRLISSVGYEQKNYFYSIKKLLVLEIFNFAQRNVLKKLSHANCITLQKTQYHSPECIPRCFVWNTYYINLCVDVFTYKSLYIHYIF